MPKPPRTCPNCKGKGTIEEYDPSDGTTDHVQCGRCGGSGQI